MREPLNQFWLWVRDHYLPSILAVCGLVAAIGGLVTAVAPPNTIQSYLLFIIIILAFLPVLFFFVWASTNPKKCSAPQTGILIGPDGRPYQGKGVPIFRPVFCRLSKGLIVITLGLGALLIRKTLPDFLEQKQSIRQMLTNVSDVRQAFRSYDNGRAFASYETYENLRSKYNGDFFWDDPTVNGPINIVNLVPNNEMLTAKIVPVVPTGLYKDGDQSKGSITDLNWIRNQGLRQQVQMLFDYYQAVDRVTEKVKAEGSPKDWQTDKNINRTACTYWELIYRDRHTSLTDSRPKQYYSDIDAAERSVKKWLDIKEVAQ